MNILERIRKSARSAVTTKELFMSKFMLDLISGKLRHVCREYRVACPSFRMIYDEHSDLTACTSLQDMILNAAHEIFDGDDELRFLKVCGVVLHELGHILFTNYTAWNMWLKSIGIGTFYPAEPQVTPELEARKQRLITLATGPMKDSFISIAFNLMNCLEDGREENFILKFIRNARFMIKGLIRFRQDFYADAPAFEQLSHEVSSGQRDKISAIIQLVLHYARFREVKGDFDPSSELGVIMMQLIPEIDEYLEAKEAVIYYGAYNRMLLILEETIEEYFDECLQEQGGSLSDMFEKQMGQGNQSSGQQEAENSSENAAEGCSSGANSGNSAEDSEDDSQGISESGSNGAGSSSSSSGELTTEEQSALKQAAAEIASQLENSLEQLIGKTVDQSANMGEQAKGSDRSAVKRRMSELSGGNGGTVRGTDAAESDGGSGTITHAEAEGSDLDLNAILNDIARRISDEKAEDMISGEIKSEYAKVSDEVKDYAAIHRDCDITMYHYSKIASEEIEAYNKIAQAVAPLVKRAVKSSNFYEKDQGEIEEDRLFCGTKLHAEHSYRKDGRIFSKRIDSDEPPNVAVAVRIDCSGSMSGDRIEAARRTCVFLYEYVLGMEKRYGVKIPLYIYGDNVWSNVRMYVYADDKFRTANEKYRLMKLDANGCNRDGLPIRMAVKRLEKEQPFAQKVLFNITDGQPNDEGYGGEPAFNDLRDITRYCEKHHIALAACAIGSDRRTIENIYGSNHFLNISDLNELPVRLVKILKRLLK